MPSTPIHQLRAICLALPEAVEKETWEAPTFRVRDKIFAMVHQVGGQASLWCKAPPGAQTILVEAAPDRFFRPPYVGHKGWIGLWLHPDPDWDEVAALVARSHAMTLPPRLARELGISNPAGKPAARSRRTSPPSRPPKRPTRSASTH